MSEQNSDIKINSDDPPKLINLFGMNWYYPSRKERLLMARAPCIDQFGYERHFPSCKCYKCFKYEDKDD